MSNQLKSLRRKLKNKTRKETCINRHDCKGNGKSKNCANCRNYEKKMR